MKRKFGYIPLAKGKTLDAIATMLQVKRKRFLFFKESDRKLRHRIANVVRNCGQNNSYPVHI